MGLSSRDFLPFLIKIIPFDTMPRVQSLRRTGRIEPSRQADSLMFTSINNQGERVVEMDGIIGG